MTSLIPKVSVGVNSRKYRRNQSCMVHGTSEIGYVFPTYARNYINDATVNIGTRTGVRLSPLFVPTMGKLDVRHYHCFVPWNRVYSPFDAFLAKEPFAFESESVVPKYLPSFCVGEILCGMFQIESVLPSGRGRGLYSGEGAATIAEWIMSGAFNVGLTCSIYAADGEGGLPKNYYLMDFAGGNEEGDVELLNWLFRDGSWNDGASDRPYGYYSRYPCIGIYPSMLHCSKKDFFVNVKNTIIPTYSADDSYPDLTGLSEVSDGSRSHIVSDYLSSLSYPSIDNCDFSYELYDSENEYFYTVCFNFNGALKRLRSIFMGLGYSFNPYDFTADTPLKLFAFYRAWFSLFGVTRDINFNDTAAAKIYRSFSNYSPNYRLDIRLWDSYYMDTHMKSYFKEFLHDLCDLTYTCPADYFTSSIQNTQQGVPNDDIEINGENSGYGVGARATDTLSPSALVTQTASDGSYVSALSIKIAQRLLTWVNKNTVVGKKIQDILYARYGKIQTDDDSTEGVIKVGVDTVPIEIGIIFNQTSGDSAPLGEFSGVGSGGSRSPKHTFVTPSYGVFITLTAVVPEMGYFQGKLRENSDGVRDSLDFPDSAYDGLGYQTVRYNELVADRQYYRQFGSSTDVGTSLGNYGRQSRYAHYKVGFNRVLGDISLPHMRDSMLAYTLDRFFNPRDEQLPVNNPIISRQGTIGGTNRIFEVVSPTDDHIIYQIYFDINVNDRLKPMSLSYDTILDVDNKSVDFTHQ